jgi:hypothetical protein
MIFEDINNEYTLEDELQENENQISFTLSQSKLVNQNIDNKKS